MCCGPSSSNRPSAKRESIELSIMRGPFYSPVASPIYSPAASTLYSPVASPIYSPARSSIRSSIRSPMRSPIGSPVRSLISSPAGSIRRNSNSVSPFSFGSGFRSGGSSTLVSVRSGNSNRSSYNSCYGGSSGLSTVISGRSSLSSGDSFMSHGPNFYTRNRNSGSVDSSIYNLERRKF